MAFLSCLPHTVVFSVIGRMKEDEWFVVRWEELENLRKKDVLSKYRLTLLS